MCVKIVPKKHDNQTEGQSEGRVSSSPGTDPKWQKFLEERDYRWRNMDLWVRSRKKRQSKEWHTSASPRPKKARSKSKIKSMLICFFDSQRIVHTEFVPQGQTVNHFYYCEVLERLRKRVVHVRPSIGNNWMLHHDNAPCHMVITVIEFLAKKGIPVVPQPPYSPDQSPFDLFLFPKQNFTLKDAILGRWKTSKNCNRPTKSDSG